MSKLALQCLLALMGLVIIWLGMNVGLGGIPTLGWQGSSDFLELTNPESFSIRDNHVRFLGGFWFGAGLMFLLASVKPGPMRWVVTSLCFMIVCGGLARLSAGDISLLTGQNILPSLLAEFILFPVLAFWVHKAEPISR